MPKIAVLGAGLAGLSSAYEFSKKGFEVTVFEKNPQEGGLAKSISGKGFLSDLGPHRFHPKNKELVEYLESELGINFIERKRKSQIFLKGKFINYPLELTNILQSVPLSDSIAMLVDYASAKIFPGKNNDSFEDWTQNRFGKKIYNTFFKGYTEKILGLDCTKISKDWSEQRIKLLDLKSILKSFSGNNSSGPEGTFFYPEKGGVGSFSKRFAEKISKHGGKILFNSKIKKIAKKNNSISGISYEHNGKNISEKFDFVVSTIPLKNLAELSDAPKNVIESASQLKFRGIVFVYLALNKKNVSDNHWIYFPEKDFFCNRISEPQNFSEKNTQNISVVCAEITCNFGDKIWNEKDDVIISKTISSLSRAGLFNESEVISSTVLREPFVYPILDLDYKKNLANARSYANSFQNLKCIGRSGSFSYQNMDASLEQGIEAAKAAVKIISNTRR
ncbi:MAG TPA: FAD-dependent oxidoreductase [archaeon]|nr:FAD-dependent oxidoreductase [archaeon]